ncbi:MAG: helix-turn-helix transcriptional regulator [bacterium]|nr:helix-turn-helix transcriptional regulator [bacterium]
MSETERVEILDSPPPGRVERRRARVRQRILDATEALTRSRGVEAVTIEDITEAADVARRTFYHYFDSKNAALVPIAREHTKDLNRRIDRVIAELTDPAEVLAVALRHTLRSLPEDPLCAWFIFESGLPQKRLREGIGESGYRDLNRGVESGRFAIDNAAATAALLSGAMIGALSDRLDGMLDDDDLDDAAQYVLRLLGVSLDEAHEIAHRPLPELGNDHAH